MEELWRALSRVVLVGRSVEDVLTEITAIATRGIPGAESTSITIVRGDRAFTAAHDGEMALAADELQYQEDAGPCLDAGRGGVVLRVDDMRTETALAALRRARARDRGAQLALGAAALPGRERRAP